MASSKVCGDHMRWHIQKVTGTFASDHDNTQYRTFKNWQNIWKNFSQTFKNRQHWTVIPEKKKISRWGLRSHWVFYLEAFLEQWHRAELWRGKPKHTGVQKAWGSWYLLRRVPKREKSTQWKKLRNLHGVSSSFGLNIKLYTHRVRFQKPGKEKLLG